MKDNKRAPASFQFSFGRAAAVGAIAACAWQCTTSPVTERRGLALVPASQMNEMGTQAYAEMKQQTPLNSDAELNERIVRIGKRIAEASGVSYQWEFTVFKEDDTVNAFCLPGGKIGVYTGILPVAKNDAGLAAILGHEVAHATAHHSQDRMSQALLTQVGVAAAGLSLGDSRYKGPLLAALGVGAQVGILLPFSRKHETEADIIGLTYMAKAGYDPQEAVELWKRMAAQEKGGTPGFLATHPVSADRVVNLQNHLRDVQPLYAASTRQPSSVLR